MANASPQTCGSCGARLPENADVCDLCGRPVRATPTPDEDAAPAEADAASGDGAPPASPSGEAPEPAPAAPSEDGSEDESHDEGPYCHSCGWQNPVDARFCSQCGTKLQQKQAAPPAAVPVDANLPRGTAPDTDAPEEPESTSDASDDSDGVGQHLTLVFTGVFVLVVGLFLITTWSQQTWSGSSTSASTSDPQATMPSGGASAGNMAAGSAGGTSAASLEDLVAQIGSAASLPPQMAERVDSLQAAMADQSETQQQSTQQQLINTYVGAGQLGAAALVQKQMAEAAGTPAAWRRTGDLLYSWMETLEGQPAAVDVAEHVVEAYQQVLTQQPGNLDVRTDMATAYLQTNSPMRGVKEINRVLDEDPDHFQARFNKGIMLVMIGRTDQAIEQFERVKGIVGEASPYYQQANQAIQTIREQEAAAAPESASPNGPASGPMNGSTNSP